MWGSVAIVLNCLLIIFLLFHVNTTADNRRTNMAVGCSTRDQRTSSKRKSKWFKVPICKYVIKKPTTAQLTLRRVDILSSADIPSTVEYFQ